MRYGVSGWAYATGWLSWLAGIAAVVVVVLSSGVISQLHVDLRGRAALIIMGLGGMALLLVLIGLVAKPSYAGLVVYLTAHLSASTIAKSEIASNWSNEVNSSALGVGIFCSLLGAAAVAVGGFLKVGEPAGAVAPVTVTEVVSNAAQTAKVAFDAARTAVKAQSSSEPSSPAAHFAVPPVGPTSASAAARFEAPPAFCTSCGAQFRSEDARFCAACGADRTLA